MNSVNRLLSQLLSTDGIGTVGSSNAIGDYTTPDDFYIEPPAGEIYVVNQLIVSIVDATGMTDALYGGLAALTNGVVVKQKNDGGTLTDLTATDPVKSNKDWLKHAEVTLHSWGTPVNDVLRAVLRFDRFGQGLRLIGDDNAQLVVTLSDNLTGLVGHTFTAQGYRLAEDYQW